MKFAKKRIPPGLTVLLLGVAFMVAAGSVIVLLRVLGGAERGDQVAGCISYCKSKGRSGSVEPTYDSARFAGMENKSGASACKCS
jgi:hypothetical protein